MTTLSEKEIKYYVLDIVCSPKKITYGAYNEEHAKEQFLEENPAFDEHDIHEVKLE